MSWYDAVYIRRFESDIDHTTVAESPPHYSPSPVDHVVRISTLPSAWSQSWADARDAAIKLMHGVDQRRVGWHMDEAHRLEKNLLNHWEARNTPWYVVSRLPVISTAPNDEMRREVKVTVEHSETGETLTAVGADVSKALALITSQLSTR